MQTTPDKPIVCDGPANAFFRLRKQMSYKYASNWREISTPGIYVTKVVTKCRLNDCEDFNSGCKIFENFLISTN
jgi:hypothetical protein